MVLDEVAQQVDDPGLGGGVESGRGFIGDEQRRVAGQREGNHDPLTQPPGQLMRIVAGAGLRVWNPDRVE